MKRLIYAETSLEDLQNLFRYAAENNLAMPEKMAEELIETCELLAKFPEMGEKREEVGPRIREFVKGKYSIIAMMKMRFVFKPLFMGQWTESNCGISYTRTSGLRCHLACSTLFAAP